MKVETRTAYIIALLAAFICLLVFLRALSCDFVNFDDQDSILENVAIRALDSNLLVSSFSTSMFGFWMPLTWISYALDYHFWGFDPLGYHLTNILLHAVNAGLLVLIADRLLKNTREPDTGGNQGYLYPAMLLAAGLLWAIHPLRVESVVWVTERKDVLNGLFALTSVLAYLRYAERTGAGKPGWPSYMVSLTLFACSLMAKPVTVVLPLMLLVLDQFPLGRLRRGGITPVLMEKAPFLLLSAALSFLTLRTAVEKDLLVAVERLSIGERFLVAGNALFEYLRMLVLPVGILPLHPMPYPLPLSYAVASAATLLLLCYSVHAARRSMALPAVLLLFLLPLLPVLGFLQNGQQAFAARYTYLPDCAASIAVAALFPAACRGLGRARLRYGAFALVAALLVLAGLTQTEIGVWKNSETLWTRVIERHPVSTAYKSRGSYYLMGGRYKEAVSDYTAAMEAATGQEKLEVYNLLAGRAIAFGSMGRFDESVRDFSAAIDLFPHPAYYYSRGITFEAMGLRNEARADLLRAGPDPPPIRWFVYGKGLQQ